MSTLRAALVAGLMLLAAGGSRAQTTTDPSASFFRDAAIRDVEAAWALLSDSHPGAAREMGDAAFRKALADGAALARARARQVTTLEGYQAVLNGFEIGFGDRHIRTTPAFTIARPDWVGLIVGLHGGRWTVVDEDPWPNRAPLRGATLLSCDGRPVEDVARERLGGFRADWTIVAQRGLAAPWLLVDEHNPFLKPLRSCRFAAASGNVDVSMDWTTVARDQIIARIGKASGAGAAGWGLRPVGKGWWIAIQELTGNAPAVVAAARAREAELRAAPFVVLDLRGDRGGSSAYGDEIAELLFGKGVATASASEAQCPEAWRVSQGNLARLESYPAMMGKRLSPEVNAVIQADIRAMRQAAATGAAFSRPLRCPVPSKQNAASRRPEAPHPQVFVLTDRVCFSSCLIVVRTFRDLGAVQIGEATNGDTWYQENRDIALPSGLARFATQAAVDPGSEPRVGPFEPDITYDGDLTDTAAVESWVMAVALQSHSAKIRSGS